MFRTYSFAVFLIETFKELTYLRSKIVFPSKYFIKRTRLLFEMLPPILVEKSANQRALFGIKPGSEYLSCDTCQ